MREEIVNIQGPHVDSQSGRKNISVYFRDGRRVVKSYPKFLVEFLLDRELDRTQETIDHIDGDFTNNNWSNMRIVPIGQHIKEGARHCKEKITVTCVWCGKTFKQKVHVLQNLRCQKRAGPFCSKRCVGKYGAEVASGTRTESLPSMQIPNSAYYRITKQTDMSLQTLADSIEIDEEYILFWIKQLKESYRLSRPPIYKNSSKICCNCNEPFKVRWPKQKFCSYTCSSSAARKTQWPTPEELEKLVWSKPIVQIAKQFGVSDKAVANWCKQYGIEKPGVGYWRKT